jgi:hypothetical protein
MSTENQIVPKESKEIAQLTESAALLQIISRAATDPKYDVDKMERLFAMHERIVARNSEQAFNVAMSEVQANLRRIAADSENKQTRSNYASYAAIDRVIRPIYTEAGFSLSFGTGEAAHPEMVRVICHVSHKGGHTRTEHIDMPADGKGAKGGDVMTKTHATGAGVQYGMRYLVKMIFNLAIGTDDDGNGSDPIQYITEYQAADLNALLEEVGADKQAFCRHFKCESVEKLPVKAYQQALALTVAKRKKGAAK